MTAKPTQLEPIEAGWKISDVIGRHPQLVEELASLNPTFRLLRNPVARRVQARLVTVAQAAQIAGIEPAHLVSALNRAIGLTNLEDVRAPDETRASASTSDPDWVDEAPVVAEVDARALQLEGKEPFGAIMAGARQVQSGEVLRLLSSFEPVPLYVVLAQRGFEHFTRQFAANDWEILFVNSGRKPEEVVRGSAGPSTVQESPAWESPDATITIDVSELVPPEPLIRIMEALEKLPEGASLLVHHVRRPIHLYPQLDNAGYRHRTREIAPGKIEILIEKPAAAQ